MERYRISQISKIKKAPWAAMKRYFNIWFSSMNSNNPLLNSAAGTRLPPFRYFLIVYPRLHIHTKPLLIEAQSHSSSGDLNELQAPAGHIKRLRFVLDFGLVINHSWMLAVNRSLPTSHALGASPFHRRGCRSACARSEAAATSDQSAGRVSAGFWKTTNNRLRTNTYFKARKQETVCREQHLLLHWGRKT